MFAAVHELPPLYHAWMADLLTGPIPRESNATCHDCAMCVKGEIDLVGGVVVGDAPDPTRARVRVP